MLQINANLRLHLSIKVHDIANVTQFYLKKCNVLSVNQAFLMIFVLFSIITDR